MFFLVAIALIPILGLGGGVSSNTDVTQCPKGCQIQVVNTTEADPRCQKNVTEVPLPGGERITLAVEGTVCRPGNSVKLHVCRRGFWIKRKITIDCPDDKIAIAEGGSGGAPVSWENPPNFSAGTRVSGSFFRIGSTAVTLSATDEYGSMAECTFSVFVVQA